MVFNRKITLKVMYNSKGSVKKCFLSRRNEKRRDSDVESCWTCLINSEHLICERKRRFAGGCKDVGIAEVRRVKGSRFRVREDAMHTLSVR